MTIWVHRPFPSVGGEDEPEHGDFGACWCNPMALTGPQALKLSGTLINAVVESLGEGSGWEREEEPEDGC